MYICARNSRLWVDISHFFHTSVTGKTTPYEYTEGYIITASNSSEGEVAGIGLSSAFQMRSDCARFS